MIFEFIWLFFLPFASSKIVMRLANIFFLFSISMRDDETENLDLDRHIKAKSMPNSLNYKEP